MLRILIMLAFTLVATGAHALVISGTNAPSSAPKSSSSVASKSSSSAVASAAISSVAATSSSTSSVSSSQSRSSTSSKYTGPTVVLTAAWKNPTQRVDGSPLLGSEIGGYEVRYRLKSKPADEYTSVTVPKAVRSYKIGPLPLAEYVLEVAVYDTNYLYSDFISAEYIPPNGVSGLAVTGTVKP